jgi:hypothetical protein
VTLSRRDYAKTMASPKRSKAAQDGAWKRTTNERKIESLRALLRDVEKHLEKDQLDGVTFEETAELLDRVRAAS